MATLIIVLILVALVTIFSVQNAGSVAVSFLAWQTDASLAIIIFLSVITGMLVGVALTSFWMLRRSARSRKHKAEQEASAESGPDDREPENER